MQGFCDKGILILPEINTINGSDKRVAKLILLGLSNIIEYFDKIGIKLECPSIMDSAPSITDKRIQWINTLTPEDMYYAEEAFNRKRRDNEIDIDESYYITARTKFKAEKGMTANERLELIDKREKLITNNYIEDSTLVIMFEREKVSRYKVKSKDEDGRIILNVNPNTLIMSARMSGESIPIEQLLDELSCARLPVSDWGVGLHNV